MVETPDALGEQLHEQPVDAGVPAPQVVELVPAQRQGLGRLQRDRGRASLARETRASSPTASPGPSRAKLAVLPTGVVT
jgi:hypothetical protein